MFITKKKCYNNIKVVFGWPHLNLDLKSIDLKCLDLKPLDFKIPCLGFLK